MAYLQTDTMPIVTGVDIGGSIDVKCHFGTSFLVSDDGLAVSAMHVLKAAKSYASKNGQHVYVVGKDEGGLGTKSVLSPILHAHEGDEGSDTCVLETLYHAPTKHSLYSDEVMIWAKVATLGYPSEATDFGSPKVSLGLRGQKGIVQRVLLPNEVNGKNYLKKFELSFPATAGMSGAPLYSYPSVEAVPVVGVILGIREAEQELSVLSEYQDKHGTWRETKIRVNSYGIAASIDHIKNVKLSPIYGGSLLSSYLLKKNERPS